LGKSTFTIDLAARVSTHSPMADGSRGEADAKGVLIVNGEDGLADTMVPRLAAAQADMASVHFLDAVPYVTDDGKILQRPVSVPADLLAVERAIKDYVVAVVVIDPLAAFLDESINSYRDSDVRRALFPLARLAERSGAAILLVRHLNKTPMGNPLYRGGGSIGIIGAARSGLLIAVDPKDENRRVMAVTKSNLSSKPPALAFHLIPDDLHACARIVWDGPCKFKASELLNPLIERENSDQPVIPSVVAAGAVVFQILRNGPRKVQDVRAEVKAAGLSWRMAEHVRQDTPWVRPRKYGRPGAEQGWIWELTPEGWQQFDPGASSGNGHGAFGEDARHAPREEAGQAEETTGPPVYPRARDGDLGENQAG
jgi:hypothetical protein